MPPKPKFTKDEIVTAAFEVVRKGGWAAFSARAVGAALNASSRPIYSFFKTTAEVEERVVRKGVDLLYWRMIARETGDPWIDHGIGYVLFALEERQLFVAMNDEHHIVHFKKYGEHIWEVLTDSLSDYPPFAGLSAPQIYTLQLNRWLLAHGLAFNVCHAPPDLWTRESIVAQIKQGSVALYEGLIGPFT